ncbi:MAG: hypothetical protein QNL01_13105 [Akkermansiaceae bacterium]
MSADDTITLIDLQLEKIMDDPKKLGQIDLNFPLLKSLLKDAEGNKLEEKERISVEMK